MIRILKELKEVFEAMQANNIIHRDIKPANIMVHDGKIKIADVSLFSYIILNLH